MNLFYEKVPTSIKSHNEDIEIVTDFREIIRLIDMLKSDDLTLEEKVMYMMQYFNNRPSDIADAIKKLWDFVLMKNVFMKCESDEMSEETDNMKYCDDFRKPMFSFEIDYPYIYSAFMHDYGVDIQTIPYMHWWNFRMLFEGLSEDNEIRKRVMYRSIDAGKIKDMEERLRIERIQRIIMLPESKLTDFDIGNAFA